MNKNINPKLDLLLSITHFFTSFAFNTLWDVRYKGIENSVLERAVYLPKHQSSLDIFLMGELFANFQKNPYYVMKDELPKFLEFWGGIPITRLYDLYLYGDKKTKRYNRNSVQIARQKKKIAYDTISKLIKQNEIIIYFPEGIRTFNRKGRIRASKLIDLINCCDADYIPVDIEYHEVKPFSFFPFQRRIDVKIKKPIRTSNPFELKEYLESQIELIKK